MQLERWPKDLREVACAGGKLYGVECLFSLKDEDVVSRGTLLPFFSFLVGYRPALSKSIRESRQAVKGRQAFRRKAFTSSE